VRIDFHKDVADRGVTDYNIGGKKLINMFCGELSNMMCLYSIGDGRRKNSVAESRLGHYEVFLNILHYLEPVVTLLVLLSVVF
jgi:hypothetical protein